LWAAGNGGRNHTQYTPYSSNPYRDVLTSSRRQWFGHLPEGKQSCDWPADWIWFHFNRFACQTTFWWKSKAFHMQISRANKHHVPIDFTRHLGWHLIVMRFLFLLALLLCISGAGIWIWFDKFLCWLKNVGQMCPQVAVAVTVACNPDLNGNALPLYYFPRWPITRIRAVNNVSLGMLKVRYPIANPQ